MFKLKRMLFLALVAMFLTVFLGSSNAALVSCTGSPDSSGNCPMESNDSRLISYPGGGVLSKYEYKTTDDTLTNTESGTIYILAPASGSPITITLPSATAGSLGMNFTFVTDDPGTSPVGDKYFWLDPSANDFIVFPFVSGTATTMAAGDKLKSLGATHDSIQIIVGKELYWYVVDYRGMFEDGN